MKVLQRAPASAPALLASARSRGHAPVTSASHEDGACLLHRLQEAVDLRVRHRRVDREAQVRAALARRGRAEDGTEDAALRQKVAEGGRARPVARRDGEDLPLGARDVVHVAEPQQPLLEPAVVGVQRVAPPIVAQQHVQRRAVADNLVLERRRREDHLPVDETERLERARRPHDDAAARRERLGEADGAEVDAVRDAGLLAQPEAAGRAAKRVSLVNDENRARRLGHLGRLRETSDGAVAVDAVDDDDARLLLRQSAQRMHVVVREGRHARGERVPE
mmetsp:Transcript_80630/g.241491  ORF Transcript_80630/g.241491 Transcript_80630/m.241491 type:complete len:278 (+) Transcript_80630:241-1074(+)